jgi:hypothetical protein
MRLEQWHAAELLVALNKYKWREHCIEHNSFVFMWFSYWDTLKVMLSEAPRAIESDE